MKPPPNLRALAQRFDRPGVNAIVLMGSYARGSPGPYSDIDLVCFTDEDMGPLSGKGSHLIDGNLVVVSQVTPDQIETWFSQPEAAVEVIAGLRSGRPLIDRNATFASLQERAQAFEWDAAMQHKANAWASKQLVGWIEEVHKGLEGLRRGDIGRMLHARFGCSWGLSRVVCVQQGVLLSGDNALYEEVTHAVGSETTWARLCGAAFGIGSAEGPLTLRDQVIAGLNLYVATAQMLEEVLQPEDTPLIMETVKLIKTTLTTSEWNRLANF
jgi:hypothetical protein